MPNGKITTAPLTRGQKAAATRARNQAAAGAPAKQVVRLSASKLGSLLTDLESVSTALTVEVGAVKKVFCALTVMVEGVEVEATYDGDDWSLLVKQPA